MSLLTTLFGGLVMVVGLHLGLGRAGVTNYWRGVVAGAVPSFVLLGYSLFHNMTLDVISIHLAVFLSTATVMTMIAGVKREESSSGIHWSIKTMIVFFLVLFLVDGAFVSISTNGVPPEIAAWFLPNASKKPVYTGFSGLTRHDEDAANAVNEQLKEVDKLRKLGWKIEIDGSNHLAIGGNGNPVRVVLIDAQHVPMNGAIVTEQLLRAETQQPMPKVTLAQRADGEYTGDLPVPQGGNWVLRTEITYEGQHIKIDRDIRIDIPE